MRISSEEWDEIDRETGADKVFAAIEELLRAAGTHPSRDGKAKMVLPDREKLLDDIIAALETPSSQAEKKFYASSTSGGVELRDANGFCYNADRLKLIYKALQNAMNFSGDYNLNDEGVSISSVVQGVLKKLN